MKKIFVTVGCLMMATASLGEAGQHTGVGGNPAVPPPPPESIVIPGLVMQGAVLPGAIIILPDQLASDDQGAGKDDQGTDQGDKDHK